MSAPASVEVLNDFDVPVLSPPLEAGRGYVAADSCCSSERHRRALLSIGNRQWLAQRFAVDWEQIDARTVRQARRRSLQPADYAIYGQQALPPPTRRSSRDRRPGPSRRPARCPQASRFEGRRQQRRARLDDGLYMLYAHLQPGR